MRRHRWPIMVLCWLFAAGCAGSPEYRAVTGDEEPALLRAMTPLMRAAYGDDLSRCRPGAAVIDVTEFNIYVVGGKKNPCDVSILVTSAVLTDLTPTARQTLLAHELGHAVRGHAVGADRATVDRRAKTATGQQIVLQTGNEQFKPEEEAEADAEAARLLTVAFRGTDQGCLVTIALYQDIAKDRRRWGRWLSRHPHPERRVEAVARACDAEAAR